MASVDVIKIADSAFCQQKYAKAISLYTEALMDERNRTEVELFRKRTHCFFELDKYQEAFDDVTIYMRRKPSSIFGYIMGGKILVKLKRYEDAANLYRRGLDIEPDNDKIKDGLLQLQREIISKFEKESKKSSKSCSVLKSCSHDPYPGDAELDALEQEILVKWELTKLPELISRIPNPKKAIEEYEEAKQLKQAGNRVSAMGHLQIALEHDPANFELWTVNAEWLFEVDELKSAFQNCQVVPREFRSKEAWLLGGKILHALDLPVNAESWLRQAIRSSRPGDDDAALYFQKVRAKRLYGPFLIGCPVEVSFTECGRSIVATDDILDDQIVFKDKPLVASQTLNSLDTPACCHCAVNMMTYMDFFGVELLQNEKTLRKCAEKYWPNRKIVICGECGRDEYCSEACRQEAWDSYHKVICSGKNKNVSVLYDVAKEHRNLTPNDKRAWDGVWNAVFSPLLLARIWGTIICNAKTIATKEGRTKPIAADWAKARAPFRRFIAYGSSSNVKVVPKMFTIMKRIFTELEPDLRYELSEREFDGRYFQASCNVQAFSDPTHPAKEFIKRVKTTQYWKEIEKFVSKDMPEAEFAGMFPVHACLNHSCVNNVVVLNGETDGKPGVTIYAVRNIAKGEEVMTSYIDADMPRRARRAKLFQSYNFWCNCRKCQYQGDGPETCTHCGTEAAKEKKFPGCGRCYEAWYCSGACQKENWKKGHKEICYSRKGKQK